MFLAVSVVAKQGPDQTGHASDVLDAHERLILDAMRGDCRPRRPGQLGPNAIHQLVAPHAWRLPFERAWRSRPG